MFNNFNILAYMYDIVLKALSPPTNVATIMNCVKIFVNIRFLPNYGGSK